MTDNEIIKALECCPKAITLGDCEKLGCPALKKEGCYYACCSDEDAFGDLLMVDALSLINRQKAEVERLKAKCENTQVGYNFAKAEIERLIGLIAKCKKEAYKLSNSIDNIKAEAIQEFAERLKTKASDFGYGKAVWVVYIDNLVKEMVGDGDDQGKATSV